MSYLRNPMIPSWSVQLVAKALAEYDWQVGPQHVTLLSDLYQTYVDTFKDKTKWPEWKQVYLNEFPEGKPKRLKPTQFGEVLNAAYPLAKSNRIRVHRKTDTLRPVMYTQLGVCRCLGPLSFKRGKPRGITKNRKAGSGKCGLPNGDSAAGLRDVLLDETALRVEGFEHGRIPDGPTGGSPGAGQQDQG